MSAVRAEMRSITQEMAAAASFPKARSSSTTGGDEALAGGGAATAVCHPSVDGVLTTPLFRDTWIVREHHRLDGPTSPRCGQFSFAEYLRPLSVAVDVGWTDHARVVDRARATHSHKPVDHRWNTNALGVGIGRLVPGRPR